MIKKLIPFTLVIGLAACSADNNVSRNNPAEIGFVEPENKIEYSIQELNISVPRDLVVSESNAYYPTADIVWHGDGQGNRYQQIDAIFQTAIKSGVSDLDGARDVVLDIQVTRFHSLTNKARYTVGGVHSISFTYALRDSKTNEIVALPKAVIADLTAFGGTRALKAERAGQGQKQRIMAHLAKVIRKELTLK